MPTSDTERRLRALEAMLARLVRVGEVVSTNPERGAVRVKFPDAGNTVSAELPVMARKTHRDKDYQMPDIGEPVLCLFLPIGPEVGFVLGATPTAKHTPPVASQDKWHKSWDDGTWLEYDRASHKLSVHVEGAVKVVAVGDMQAEVGGDATVTAQGNAVVDAALIDFKGGNGGATKGVVQGDCRCAFTGAPHPMISATVKGSR